MAGHDTGTVNFVSRAVATHTYKKKPQSSTSADFNEIISRGRRRSLVMLALPPGADLQDWYENMTADEPDNSSQAQAKRFMQVFHARSVLLPEDLANDNATMSVQAARRSFTASQLMGGVEALQLGSIVPSQEDCPSSTSGVAGPLRGGPDSPRPSAAQRQQLQEAPATDMMIEPRAQRKTRRCSAVVVEDELETFMRRRSGQQDELLSPGKHTVLCKPSGDGTTELLSPTISGVKGGLSQLQTATARATSQSNSGSNSPIAGRRASIDVSCHSSCSGAGGGASGSSRCSSPAPGASPTGDRQAPPGPASPMPVSMSRLRRASMVEDISLQRDSLDLLMAASGRTSPDGLSSPCQSSPQSSKVGQSSLQGRSFKALKPSECGTDGSERPYESGPLHRRHSLHIIPSTRRGSIDSVSSALHPKATPPESPLQGANSMLDKLHQLQKNTVSEVSSSAAAKRMQLELQLQLAPQWHGAAQDRERLNRIIDNNNANFGYAQLPMSDLEKPQLRRLRLEAQAMKGTPSVINVPSS